MIRVKWDIEECIVLVDIYRRHNGNFNNDVIEDLRELTVFLSKRADSLGIVHDEKFRNLDGVKLIYFNLQYIATDGEHGMPRGSHTLEEAYTILKDDPGRFETRLNEIKNKYR